MSSYGAEWLEPRTEEAGLSSYLRTLRERSWLVVLAVVITTGAAIAYALTADKVYEAEAGILVTPVPVEAETLVSLGLLSRSADPVRDVETIAGLIATREVAERASEDLGDVPEAQSPDRLLESIQAQPLAESNIVSVTAEAGSAEDAAAIANAVVAAAIAERSATLQGRVAERLRQLETEIAQNPADQPELSREVSELKLLDGAEDPTIAVATRAEPPTSPIRPRPLLSTAAGLLAGLAIGLGAAFAYHALDPRLRREEQLRSLFRLPILARIPKEGSRRRDPLMPRELSPPATEAYRALRAMVTRPNAEGRRPRSILVTSASASEGKTTTAINLATSLAIAGNRVILVEGDLRKPEVGKAFSVGTDKGILSVLLGETSVARALVEAPGIGDDLQLLLAEESAAWTAEVLALGSARKVVLDTTTIADYVVIDSAPLSEVVDALPLAAAVDEVLLVARLGRTRISQLTELGELLGENGIRPLGVAVVGAEQVARAYHYGYARHLMAGEPDGRPPDRGSS